MIPAILAAPVVQGVVGSVASSVAGGIQSMFSSATPSSSSPFNPLLERAAAQAAANNGSASAYNTPSGAMTSLDWSQMNPNDVQAWMKSLTGKYVHATDVSGRTVSGVVNGVTLNGTTPTLNVGGHLVSLSQANQITWSPAIH